MQSCRVETGGRINRQKPLRFRFNGAELSGFEGDTLASALLANGVSFVARSIKYHRARGIMGIGSEEPNALVQLSSGSRSLCNLKATQVELYNDLEARSVNSWPSLRIDLMSLNNLISRFLPPGFYYKTFKWPSNFWRVYEHILRSASGFGTVPEAPDPDRYDKANVHCDVLVIGGGGAGLAAAREAARAGARVILADEHSEFGGRLLDDGVAAATSWITETILELRRNPDVRLMPRTTVFGYYDHNFLGAFERVSDHLAAGDKLLPRQRLWRVRAKQVVIATGAYERPLVFHDNDRPGIMLASAALGYLNRYAVRAGKRAIVFTNNDSAYSTALALRHAGAHVIVLDIRESASGPLAVKARQEGIEVLADMAVLGTQGSPTLTGVTAGTVRGTAIENQRRFECDLLAISGGWSPALDMHCQSGSKARYDSERTCFVPGISVQQEQSAGSCNGTFDTMACITEGALTGAQAAQRIGFGTGAASETSFTLPSSAEQPLKPTWVVPSTYSLGRGPKQFVDFQNDTSAGDILTAAQENFHSIEHIKRYTLLGFGTDQGKLSNVNGIGILAQILGKDMNAIGTTTFRPAYSPVAFGTLAGREIGALADPVRKTAIHEWHEEVGAVFENVGQWKRPHYYPLRGESMHTAVRRECLATQRSVGVLDASTLGKIDVRGPDAAEFLNRIYTNDKGRLAVGRCSYGLMLGEDGMVFDDGLTGRVAEDHFWLTTTTGGAARVMAWLERWLQTEWTDLRVFLTSTTDHFTVISVNGPNSRSLLSKVSDGVDLSAEAFPFMAFRDGTLAGIPARFVRVSFSGELAFEVFVPANHGRAAWNAIFEAGKPFGITPYGTETMHVLRAEKGYVIVGQDTDGSLTPADLGMNWIVSKNKDFLGKRSLARADTVRPDRKQFVGLLTEDPRVVLSEGAQIIPEPLGQIPASMIGHVTSSYDSARVGRSVALAVVKNGHALFGSTVYVVEEGRRTIKATVAKPNFYDPEGKLQNA